MRLRSRVTAAKRTNARHRIMAVLVDRKFRVRVSNALFHCGIATASLASILLVENVVLRAAFVVALTLTTFTVFVVPHSIACKLRRVIEGRLVTVVAASVFAAILSTPALESTADKTHYLPDVMAALSVGLGLLIMVARIQSPHLLQAPPSGSWSRNGTGRP